MTKPRAPAAQPRLRAQDLLPRVRFLDDSAADIDILARISGGARRACHDPATRRALHRLAMDADDLRQQVALHGWRSYGRTDAPSMTVHSLPGLVAVLIGNAAANLRSRAACRPMLSGEPETEPPDGAPNPEQAAILRQQVRHLGAALRSLPARHRQALQAGLRGAGGATIRQRLRRARSALRRVLEGR